MKKFFSILALVGVFAACKPETIQTAFTVAGAKATVTVDVVDHYGAPISGYTLAVSTTGSLTPSVSGNVVTFEAAAGSTIPAQTVTLTVSNIPEYLKDYTTTITVPEILAGGVADLKARIVVFPESVDDWTFTVIPEEPVIVLDHVNFLENKHYKTHDHVYKHTDSEGDEVTINTWYVNDSEYILEGVVKYMFGAKGELVSVYNDVKGFDSTVTAFAESYEFVDPPVEKELKIKVSAYGMWTAYQKHYFSLQPFRVSAKNVKTNEVVEAGSFTVETDYCSVAEYIEIGMPAHIIGHVSGHNLVHGHVEDHTAVYEHYEYAVYSHYHAGHGIEGHGYNNAGGGIAYAE